MAQTVRELMTTDPVRLDPSASAGEAAQAMRDHDIGAIIVATHRGIRGIVTTATSSSARSRAIETRVTFASRRSAPPI